VLDNRNQRIALGVAAGVLVLGGVTAALVSGGSDDAATTTTTEATTTTTEATTTTAPQPVAPLTGVPGDYGDRLSRPALVVKIDNAQPDARPQAGINQADVVYEERVEGSVTRLLAVFHSTDSLPVGPVRSARTSDIAIVSALHRPYFAWSGANATFARRIRAANLVDVGYDARSGEYFREPSRRAPHNLMLKSTATLQALGAEGAAPPPALFPYRATGQETAHLEPVAGVRVTFGSSAGAAPVEYRWDGNGWARTQAGTPHVDAASVQVAPANVVVQFVSYASSDVNDQFGNPIPEAQTVGEGDAWVLTSGGLVQGRWHKQLLDTVTTFTDADGNPILFTPGRTWVELPPPGGAARL
jgi:Protein of unknown function (DUF3048) N-terminal domain/Protein of unknown function (DUF3048) C-terminal domain